jgi:hypothetical protein
MSASPITQAQWSAAVLAHSKAIRRNRDPNPTFLRHPSSPSRGQRSPRRRTGIDNQNQTRKPFLGDIKGYGLAFAIQPLVLLSGVVFPQGPHPNWTAQSPRSGTTTNFSG